MKEFEETYAVWAMTEKKIYLFFSVIAHRKKPTCCPLCTTQGASYTGQGYAANSSTKGFPPEQRTGSTGIRICVAAGASEGWEERKDGAIGHSTSERKKIISQPSLQHYSHNDVFVNIIKQESIIL